MIRLTALFTSLLAAAALAACGERKETTTSSAPAQPVSLMLDYLPNADHAGIYAAEADGLFDKAKIDLNIQTPADPAAPLKLLTAGKVDLAISYEPEVLLARDQGAQIVSIAAIVQRPLTSVISLKGSGVETIRDLKGKKVGTAGIPYQSAFLKTMLTEANVEPEDVEEVNVGFNLTPAMVSKKVDATLGAFWNYEGVQLQQKKKDPNIIKVDDAGVPTYNELVLVARVADLQKRGPLIRRTVQSIADGYNAVKENPEKAADQLVKANPDLDKKLQLASIKATIPVFFPENDDYPFGFQNSRQWAKFGAWMLQNDLIRSAAAPGSLSNEFLPGQGLAP
jgi:putative hydroxymethylpyrimidine transport system substrate-binding protein